MAPTTSTILPKNTNMIVHQAIQKLSAFLRHPHLQLLAFSVVNLLFMHYYILFSDYLEWKFLFSSAANFFSVLFDVFFLLAIVLPAARLHMKGALATVFVLTSAWSFVNVFYVRFFYIYFPLAAIGEATSLGDGLVVDNMLSGFQLTDLFYPLSIAAFVWRYRRTPTLCVRFKAVGFTPSALS